ncbi:MAG: peptidylprolyl isomerase [Alphaproteobacteria bacterium]|nr:peptidylprolyl isomerase [Alphaproteobacteria bacterium]
MKIFIPFLCMAISFLGISFPAKADLINIAAVVNDDAISDYDLEMRMKFVMGTSSIPDTPENRRNIKEQILNIMIDEKLKKQEAKKNGITNSETDINDAIAMIEKQNGLPSGALPEKLKEIGVPFDTLREQVDADLLWLKTAHATLGERIKVSDDEVNYRLSRIKEDTNKNQALLADIFLPIEDEEKSSEVYATAMQILEALHSGSSFENLARQFSASMTAQSGGDMGWVPEGSLEKELNEAISSLGIGQVSFPIKTASGYHLILVRDRKYAGGNKLLNLAKITVPKTYLAANPSFPAQLSEKSATCESFVQFGKSIFSEGSGNLGEVSFPALPEDVQALLKDLPDLKPSAPLVSDEKNVYFMICQSSSEDSGIELPSADQIRRMIESERLDLLSQRKLRDIRSSAILEKRD